MQSVISVTRLSDFWNFLATNFITIVAKKFHDFVDSFEIDCFLSHTGYVTFWTTFGKLGLLLISPSGHTECDA